MTSTDIVAFAAEVLMKNPGLGPRHPPNPSSSTPKTASRDPWSKRKRFISYNFSKTVLRLTPLVHDVTHFNPDRCETARFDRLPKPRRLNRLPGSEHDTHAACVEVHGSLLYAIDALDRAPYVKASARSGHALDQNHRVRNGPPGHSIRLLAWGRGCTSHRRQGQRQDDNSYMRHNTHLILLQTALNQPGGYCPARVQNKRSGGYRNGRCQNLVSLDYVVTLRAYSEVGSGLFHQDRC